MSEPRPRAWGAPLARLDQIWTNLEGKLAVGVIVTEIATLAGWVALKGFGSAYTAEGNVIGLIFRSVTTAIVLGIVAHLATRPKAGAAPSKTNPIAVTSAVLLGLLLGRLWLGFGVAWTSNLVEWIQGTSAFSLVGGPRGVVTRLTLWLALLGASLAASRGKHINIDVATRYLSNGLAKPVAILGWLAASAVCFAAAWGFTDSIAVIKFRAEAFHACPAAGGGGEALCPTSGLDRVAVAARGVSSDFFLFRKQVELDLMTLPRVLQGKAFDDFITPVEWNTWVKNGGWTDYYPKEAVDSILIAEDQNIKKMPTVVEPGTGDSRNILIRDLDFVLPFGLLVVALKFLLRVLRAMSGHVKVDPNAAHDDEDMKHAHDHDKDVEVAEADVVPAGRHVGHAAAAEGSQS